VGSRQDSQLSALMSASRGVDHLDLEKSGRKTVWLLSENGEVKINLFLCPTFMGGVSMSTQRPLLGWKDVTSKGEG